VYYNATANTLTRPVIGMRMISAGIALLLITLLVGCNDLVIEPAATTGTDASLSEFASKNHAPGKSRNFVAPLSGAQEVPSNNSRARGNATFQFSKDGTEMHYKLIVANIENVLQAHIHWAPAGANGPVVLWLYPSAPPAQLIPGRTQGILAEGTITADDLVGQLAGEPLSALHQLFVDGEAYVNVHTSQFPPGEIRGQIR
jgi:hypothetical protein